MSSTVQRGEKVTVSVPARVSLGGDYAGAIGGTHLSAPVNMYTDVSVTRNPEADEVIVVSERFDKLVSSRDARQPKWAQYVISALEAADLDRSGLEITIGDGIPAGVGFGTASALCLGAVVAVSRTLSESRTSVEVVDATIEAVKGVDGVEIGRGAAYTALHGTAEGILAVDFTSGTRQSYDVDFGNTSLLVVDSGVHRMFSGERYKQRQAELEDARKTINSSVGANYTNVGSIPESTFESVQEELRPTLQKRLSYVIREERRVERMAKAFTHGEFEAAGEEMFGSFVSLRDELQVSCQEVTRYVEIAQEIDGVHGATLNGNGWGGSVVVLCEGGAVGEYNGRLDRSNVPVAGFYEVELADGVLR